MLAFQFTPPCVAGLVEPWRKPDLALSPKAGDPTLFFHTEDRATLAEWTLLLAKDKAPAGTTFR